MPIARPLWLGVPGDPQAARQEQEWLLGPDVLVAPVVEQGATARDVYLPAGCWTRPDTGERFPGTRGRSIRAEAPLGALPYFFRCGTTPFRPSSCLARRVKIGPRNIGRLALGQSRARTANRAKPLGTVSRRTRVLRYCVKGNSRFRGVAVFDTRGRLRLAATNATGHTRRRIGRGATTRALRRRFGTRLRRLDKTLFIVRAPRRSRSRVVFGVRKGKVGFVGIADRRLAKRRFALRRYIRRARLG